MFLPRFLTIAMMYYKMSAVLYSFLIVPLCYGAILDNYNITMSKRTVLNENYKGLVENFSIPAEVHERDGKKYASFGEVVPIHCCTPEEVAAREKTTHHYCDIFTERALAPLGELAYVRLDDNTAEKVFINRSKRLLVVSHDGALAQWRAAPSFESANVFVAGTPIVNKDGELVSVVTAKRGNHYAVSNFEGEGGYFATTNPWTIINTPEGASIYGDRSFNTRAEVREYIASLPPPELSELLPPKPVLHTGHSWRLALVTHNGVQLAHFYLHGVIVNNIEYL
ncbi:poxin isoform X1 [Manduca sexta]|uniref:poxin isoform X1 n=2 Tax=Manduca sexta TaxID=7130 RepID=UPI00188FEFB5|nr:poxin isoform X1 [Manduca sexta]